MSRAASARARVRWVESWAVARTSAAVSRSALPGRSVSVRSGTMSGATPSARSRADQNAASNCTGSGTEGTPARSAAAVVPAPA